MTTSGRAAQGDDRESLETRMIRSACAGEPLDLLGPLTDRAMLDADVMQGWGQDQSIQAAQLQRLLVVPGPRLHAKGVQLRGIRISGQLDLESAKLLCPLRLEDCYLDGAFPVILDYAEVSLLAFIRCRLGGLSGSTLKATKGIDLTGSTLTRPLMLPDADITGRLCCSGAQLCGAESDGRELAAGDRQSPAARRGYALDADGMKVHGDVILDQDFTAAGGIWLNRADIAGELSCKNARLSAAAGIPGAGPQAGDCAMYADGLKVGDSVLLSRCTADDGGIRLSAATISGELICKGTHLNGADGKGNALRANQLKVSGNVSIGGDTAGQNPAPDDGRTFIASGGKVSLTNAAIGGELRLQSVLLGKDKRNVALDATGAHITQKLVWLPAARVDGQVILENAAVGRLEDSWSADPGVRTPRLRGYWPADGLLRLDGLTYGSIANRYADENNGANQRLEWIASQYGTAARSKSASFATQPYEQLANFYLQNGRDADARRVAIARRRDQRRYGEITRPGSVGNWLLDNTIRYGYRTWRAAVLLAILYAFVVGFLWCASHHGAIIAVQASPAVPTSAPAARTMPAATRCTKYYPCFNPFGYAIDTVIPIINVHQADFWAPNARAGAPWGWGWATVLVTYLGTALGWLFATLAVAGYTGLARNAAAP